MAAAGVASDDTVTTTRPLGLCRPRVDTTWSAIGRAVRPARQPPDAAFLDSGVERGSEAAGAPIPGSDEAGQVVPIDGALLRHGPRHGLDLVVEGVLAVARCGVQSTQRRAQGRTGTRLEAPEPVPFALGPMGCAPADPILELVRAPLALGARGLSLLGLLGGLAVSSGDPSGGAVLGRLEVLLRGQGPLLQPAGAVAR